ncbi:MAG: YraN family protein [Bacteroidales bacterium]|nr:YraN family protein [Candidatus Equimonas enterica]
MALHNDLGKWGESVAAEYMEQKGWYIRHRDWRYDKTDIDLVCIDEDDTTLVFVEVKTRSTADYGRPSEAVDADKRRRIVQAATAYKMMSRKENRMTRYDIIAIVGTPETQVQIEHIENAFNLLDVFEDYHTKRR